MWRRRKKVGLPFQPQFDTLISEKILINGDLEFRGGIHLDGTVVGNVSAQITEVQNTILRISRDGEVRGNVYAPNVIINGRVNGDVYASNFVELARHACINGNVFYRYIEMAVGAEVNGNLVHQSGSPTDEEDEQVAVTVAAESPSFTEA